MARITVEDCLGSLPNRFALVMLVSKRAKQLLRGATATVENEENKIVVNALREVAQGTVNYDEDPAQGSMEAQISRDLMR